MIACPNCAAELESPLACPACGPLPHSSASDATAECGPFDALGIELAYDIDLDALTSRMVGLSRVLHPDYYGGAGPAIQELAQENTAAINAAHAILADDYRRADWILGHLGGPDRKAERDMPRAFLLEVLEWNETLEQARESAPGSPQRRSLDQLAGALASEREETLAGLRSRLVPLPANGDEVLVEVRRLLNAIRYMDRALDTIEELRLEQVHST